MRDEPLDLQLRALLHSGLAATPDEATLARGRARLRALLDESPPREGSRKTWRRRAGIAALGAGGLWSAMAGTAAAHKLAAGAIALSLLAGGTVAASEVPGVPHLDLPFETLRGSLTSQLTSRLTSPEESSTRGSGALQAASGESSALESEGGARVVVSDAGDLPGNLVERVQPTGRFSARAELLAVRDETGSEAILVRMASGAEVWLPVGDAAVIVPGPPAERDLTGRVGSLVVLHGACPSGRASTECVLDRVVVLGAGQPAGGPARGNAAPSEGAPGAPGGGPPPWATGDAPPPGHARPR